MKTFAYCPLVRYLRREGFPNFHDAFMLALEPQG